MTRTITTHTADDPVDDIVATLNREGAAVITNLVAPEFMDTLTANLPFDPSTKVGNEFLGGSDNRSIGAVLHANAELCETLLLNERILEVADRMLLPENPMAASSEPMPRLKYQTVSSDDGCAQFRSVVSPPKAVPTATITGSAPQCRLRRVTAERSRSCTVRWQSTSRTWSMARTPAS